MNAAVLQSCRPYRVRACEYNLQIFFSRVVVNHLNKKLSYGKQIVRQRSPLPDADAFDRYFPQSTAALTLRQI